MLRGQPWRVDVVVGGGEKLTGGPMATWASALRGGAIWAGTQGERLTDGAHRIVTANVTRVRAQVKGSRCPRGGGGELGFSKNQQ
jgi:hypothetical protein